MRTLPILSLALLASVLLNSCSSGGLAGGPGNPTLFGSTPPVPSVPVQLGTYVVRCTAIDTNPVKLKDRFQALQDTITITLASGPSSSAVAIHGEYLDPRINDQIYLRDRGGNSWTAVNNQLGTSQTIITDAAGAPQQYIIGTVSTSTLGTSIAAKRTFSFGYPLPGAAPGLFVSNVQGDDNEARPPTPGDNNCFVISAIGLCQWEHDLGTNFVRYYVDLSIPGLRGQYTQFSQSDDPQNIEEEDILPFPLYIGGEQRNETNHTDGTHVQSWDSAIFAVSSPSKKGTVSQPSGIYIGHPYYLTDGLSPVSYVVNQGSLRVLLTANGTTDSLSIISLTINDLVAVRAISSSSYEIMDLQRNLPTDPAFPSGPADPTILADSTAILNVTTFSVVPGQADQPIGNYSVTNFVNAP